MRPRTRLDALTTTLLAALGAGSLGCGGSVVTSAGSEGSAGSGAGNAINQFPCLNPTPIINETTGYQTCDNGEIRRTRRAQCPSLIPRAEPVPDFDPSRDPCQYDSDCTGQPHGYCSFVSGADYAGIACRYGCATDADCRSGSICVCGDPIGECQRSTCTSGADCVPGFDCRTHESDPGCSITGFACQVPGDSCGTNQDCGALFCSASSGVRQCEPQICIIGRPFLVYGAERVAPCAARHDWLDVEIAPSLDG